MDTSALSVYSDEGLDLSQRLSESIFGGPDLEADSEEIVYGMSVYFFTLNNEYPIYFHGVSFLLYRNLDTVLVNLDMKFSIEKFWIKIGLPVHN